ncbi:DinB family protein [Deinococcus aetherius]
MTELAHLYQRDLAKLVEELDLYPDEASLWGVQPGIVNPAGNLALHLVGNLSLFIGQELGGIPYVRDRPAEFGRKDVPRAELLDAVRATAGAVQTALAGLDAAALKRPSPVTIPGFPEDANVEYLLMSLYGHLNWHLGQINYHRRLLSPQA